MSEIRFFRCEEVRCPTCGALLVFLKPAKNSPLLIQHPKAKCANSEKKFYAAPLVVNLQEWSDV